MGDCIVADLIDEDRKGWKDSVVREMFPEDAEKILAMPISPRLPSDCRVWGLTTHGKFSVRSAYRLATEIFSRGSVDTVVSNDSQNHWSQLWRLKILPKIIHFMWQACNNGLPNLSNLVHRGMNIDPICKLCGEGVETQDHLFIHCPQTKVIWYTCALRIHDIASLGSIKNLMWFSMTKYPAEYVELIAVVAWNIWRARNKVYFEDGKWEVRIILEAIQKSWDEMGKCRQKCRPDPMQQIDVQSDITIEPGWFILETDVAVLSATKIGMGFVLKHVDGSYILSAKDEMNAAGSSTLLEGLAMRYAISMVLERNFARVLVKSDSLNLIRALNNNGVRGEFEAVIVDDIKQLAEQMNCIKFRYHNRNDNKIAHAMARGPIGIFESIIPSHIVNMMY